YDGNPNVDECVARALCQVERYGFSESANWHIVDLVFEPARTRWSVLREGSRWADFEFALAGEHNVLNAAAAAALAAHYGIAPGAIAQALRTFKSVKRRLEVKAEVNGITLIDDFAHHPTAIAETLKALRTRYSGRRLWALLEPRSNTLRRNVFQQDLADSLALADRVVIAALNRRGTPARQLADADAIVAAVVPELVPGDVVAVLSNGGFGGIYEKLPARLKSLAREVPV